MTVIYTTYATIKMLGPKGIIILKSDQHDALACENVALTHAGQFSKKEAQELAVKVAKAHRGSTLIRRRARIGHLPRRRTHSWVLRQTSPVSIKQWMTRRKGLLTRR
jgi:hypothetical protein